MSLKSALDKYEGHRTFILAVIVVIPFMVKGLMMTGSDLGVVLQFMGGLLRDVFIGLGASKAGSAALYYSRNRYGGGYGQVGGYNYSGYSGSQYIGVPQQQGSGNNISPV